jgi:hypothetical protein
VGECLGVIFTTARLSREISGNAALPHANTPEMVWRLNVDQRHGNVGGRARWDVCLCVCSALVGRAVEKFKVRCHRRSTVDVIA